MNPLLTLIVRCFYLQTFGIVNSFTLNSPSKYPRVIYHMRGRCLRHIICGANKPITKFECHPEVVFRRSHLKI